ncbi:PD-(D/E)XK nuclease family protein [Alicyclobacillus fastidiosus]|uniref:PD-(D/E)XK nuclease family protein n=1 Tax=Alicyclobacillus fastidiosus TaxID=392011 RepID=A0ABY6ZLF2_9BACL|nr:PD-(D/E)XK nuclease family protein [Alicyclobacillus fastidiosus]WAH43677.1 PD-(D/E)XK nuclease family protein [Alicyclobacillus fastidiosus]GMA59881.1 ATP-dependent helicase/deoxyribonuclease subunit B [Alicyclobacillus fastidiosus]
MTDVRFWLGPTGSGKSQTIVRELRQETERTPIGSTLFWVVPDDVAFAAEQMLMAQIPSTLRCEVITLPRLAERIRRAAGDNDEQPINASGKQLLFAAVYRELRDTLGPLKRAEANVGFHRMVLDTFDEMSQYRVNLSALEGALESAAASLDVSVPRAQMSVGRSLIGKLRDLVVLYIRYRERLAEKGFFDPALSLASAAQSVTDVPFVAESTFYFDGFHTLTPEQVELMAEIARHATQCTFTFPLSQVSTPDEVALSQASAQWPQSERLARWLPDFEHNYSGELPGVVYSVFQLSACLLHKGVQWTCTSMEPDAQERPSLASLERVFRGVEVARVNGLADVLSVWEAEDDESEAYALADDILRLVEQQGVSFRDIAILVPSLNEEGNRIHEVLERYDVPHSMDTFPPLAAHALGRFILAALRAVIEDLSTDSMARLLRTEFHGIDQATVDWFDMYLRSCGVASAQLWFQDEDWSFLQQQAEEPQLAKAKRDDERANRIRKSLTSFLQPFYDALCDEILTPLAFAQALWQLLTAVDAKSAIAESVVREDVDNNPLQASQHEQAWQLTIGLLNDLASVYADAQFVREDLFELVTCALIDEKQSTIPSGLDEVLIRPYAHAHGWTRPYVFVLGASDHALPTKVQSSGLLQDDEREMFATLFGIPIGFTSQELMAVDQLLPYMLFTRATGRLTISFARTRGGAEQRPSPYVTRICQACDVWPQRVRTMGEEGLQSSGRDDVLIMRSSVALDLVVQLLSQAKHGGEQALLERAELADIAAWFCATEERKERLHRAIAGLYHRLPAGVIERGLARRLYGAPLVTSVHRLETYAVCPYQYFIRFGLRVEPDVQHATQAAEVGNLLHDTVFELADLHRRKDVRFDQLSLSDMVELAERVFAEKLLESRHMAFQSGIRGARADDLRNYLQAIAEALWLQATNGSYEPYQLEWSFGMPNDEAPAFPVDLPKGEQVLIRGRVDRLDLYEDGDTTWYRIFDYKSGSSYKLDATRMYFGLQIQLMVYLAVVQASLAELGKRPRPAGAFYMPLLRLPGISEVPQAEDLAKAELRKAYRPEGYLNTDARAIAAMDRHLPGAKSELFGDLYKKDGAFRQTAKVWTDDEWEAAIDFTLNSVRDIATQLGEGKIPVRPYVFAHNDRGCTNCAFKGVCHFEPMDHASAYRVLTSKRFADIVRKSAEESELR